MQLSSAICPRDMSEELLSPGIIDAFFALLERRCDRGISPSSFDFSIELFGNVTLGPSTGVIFFKIRLSSSRQYELEAPLSAFAIT